MMMMMMMMMMLLLLLRLVLAWYELPMVIARRSSKTLSTWVSHRLVMMASMVEVEDERVTMRMMLMRRKALLPMIRRVWWVAASVQLIDGTPKMESRVSWDR
jgi:Lon protease-like protein